MKLKQNIIRCLFCAAVINVLMVSRTTAEQRGLRPGEKMPEFSAFNLSKINYNYKHGKGQPLLLMFISTGQQGSYRAASDINQIISNAGENAKKLGITIIVEDSNSVFEESEEYDLLKKFNIILDSEYRLWGKFGIIATPTVIISDANDSVEWVKAGHNYDFIPNVRNHINQVLGLSEKPVEDEIQVKTAVNDTNSSHVKRLLDMAKILSDKGKIESAIEEVSKAKELDPNSNEVNLDLAELLCKANKSQEALDVIVGIHAADNAEKARILTLSGWANRQMDMLDEAQRCLLEALTTDPQSIRAMFELGNVYQAKGQTEKAMKIYYEALTIILKDSRK